VPCRQSLDGRELEASLKGRGLFFQLNGSEQRLCIVGWQLRVRRGVQRALGIAFVVGEGRRTGLLIMKYEPQQSCTSPSRGAGADCEAGLE
jgi:hypothetical protein